MTKLILSSIYIFLILVNAYPQKGYWNKNTDSEWDPATADYRIETAAQLAQFALLVNNGNTFENKTFTLANDIDLSAHFWVPIGEESSTPFCGTFDGNDNIIKGLTINNNITDYPGTYSALFGRISGEAQLRYIILADGEVKGGMGDGTLTASLVADVSPEDDSKPILIKNCYNRSVKVTAGSGARGGRTGGLIASVKTPDEAESEIFIFIESCANMALITGVSTSNFTGGLIGFASAGQKAIVDIKDCFNKADITGSKDCTGGLIGRMQSSSNGGISLWNCASAGKVYGGEGYTGGLVGHLRASGENSTAKIASSDVVKDELKGNKDHTGIFVGKNENGILEDNSEGKR